MSYGPADLMRAVLGSSAGSMLSVRASANGARESFRAILDDLAAGGDRARSSPPAAQGGAAPASPGPRGAAGSPPPAPDVRPAIPPPAEAPAPGPARRVAPASPLPGPAPAPSEQTGRAPPAEPRIEVGRVVAGADATQRPVVIKALLAEARRVLSAPDPRAPARAAPLRPGAAPPPDPAAAHLAGIVQRRLAELEALRDRLEREQYEKRKRLLTAIRKALAEAEESVCEAERLAGWVRGP